MKILVPVDGSENSLRALDYVIGAQTLFRDPVEIHLLNVQRPIVSGNVKSYISAEQLHAYYQDEGALALKKARERLEGSGVVHRSQIVIGEEPACISQYAAQNDCQMIVIGTRGMGGMANLILGSVASRVVHLSNVPVLLIR